MRRTTWALLFVSLSCCGCGEEPLGNKIHGTVTLAGKPLDRGVIQFTPMDKQQTQSGATIENGEYEIPATAGLEPGKYQVRIMSGEFGPAVEEEIPGIPAPPSKERIPPDYNSQTKQSVEVKDDSPNEFNFQIP